MNQIKVYGTNWCGDTRRAVRILDDRNVDYEWIDIDSNPAGEKFVKETNNGNRSVPTIVFSDESILAEPSNQVLIDKLDSLGI
jgi:glutaredoxin